MKVLKETKINKAIHYGDGYSGIEYVFDTPVTREEFVSFCEEKGHKMKGLDHHAWYEDHAKIENPNDEFGFNKNGPSDVWLYKWVRVYTD